MLKIILAALVALGLTATVAPATTYTADVTATPFRVPGSPGLQTRAWKLTKGGSLNFTGSTINFDLANIGDSVTMDIYRLVSFDIGLDPDDLIPQVSTATFDFGALGSVTIRGTTQGVLGPVPSALAMFVDDAINIGGGLRILISLADTTFATDGANYVWGGSGAAVVRVTFTLAEVPVPAAGGAALAGLGGLAFMVRKRRGAAAGAPQT